MIPPGILPFMMLHGITLDRGSRLSLRRQLVGHLEARILGGQIEPGRQLPSVRRAEELLGLHRNTVAAAYRDLILGGLARVRPGAGVYARSPADSSRPPVASVGWSKATGVTLECADPELRLALRAELRERLGAPVHESSETGPSVRIRLAPDSGFTRTVHSLETPSLVAVVSASEHVHRTVAASVLIHGGEGVAYLPVFTGKREDLDRALRLSAVIFADHAALDWTRGRLTAPVRPVFLISAHSWTELRLLVRRAAVGSRGPRRRARRLERTLQSGVKEP